MRNYKSVMVASESYLKKVGVGLLQCLEHGERGVSGGERKGYQRMREYGCVREHERAT